MEKYPNCTVIEAEEALIKFERELTGFVSGLVEGFRMETGMIAAEINIEFISTQALGQKNSPPILAGVKVKVQGV